MHNKELFKQAIAEAKSVREAAIANAKDALEETLTPHLKSMLAAKLQEMEESEDEPVEEGREDVDVNIKDTTDVSTQLEEEFTFEEEEEEESGEEEAGEEAEVEPGESGDEAGEEAIAGDDEEITSLTVGDLKALMQDLLLQAQGGAPEEEIPGEEIPGEEVPGEELPADVLGGEGDEEEIDLDELLRELQAMEESEVEEGQFGGEPTGAAAAGLDNIAAGLKTLMKKGGPIAKKAYDLLQDLGAAAGQAMRNEGEVTEEDSIEELRAELNEALKTIKILTEENKETNLLNAKLLYVNKVFKANNLTEAQKVNVITAFDSAENVKEVKLVYETISKNVISTSKKGTSIQENKLNKLGLASKPTGTTASKGTEVITEANEAVRRMQKLAGIIK